MYEVSVWLPARVVVDPNSVSRRDPTLSVATFGDADRVPEPGEIATAVQPDVDDVDYVGVARVEAIDRDHGLIYLRVDWNSFTESSPFETHIDEQVRETTIHTYLDFAQPAGFMLDSFEHNSTTPGPRVLVGQL
jgi:hypothetical protein